MSSDYDDATMMNQSNLDSNSSEIMDNSTPVGTGGNSGGGGGGGAWVVACYFIVSILGFLGNTLVVTVIVRVKRMRTVPNLFILHQSIVDLISSFLVLCLTITDVSLPENYIISQPLCKMWLSRYPLWSCYMVSTMNLVSLTLERYHSILRPLQHEMLVSKERVVMLFPILWVLGWTFLTYLTVVYNVDESGTMCTGGRLNVNLQVGLGIVTCFLYYILPLAVMMFAYLSMLLEIRKQKDTVAPSVSASSSAAAGVSKKDQERQKIERNILKVLFLVVLVYFICWGPNQMAYLQFNLGGHLDFDGTFFHISVIMITCNVTINPFIYAIKYQQFRQGLRSMLCINSNQVDPDGSQFENSQSYSASRHPATLVESTA